MVNSLGSQPTGVAADVSALVRATIFVRDPDRVMPVLVDAGARWASSPQRFELGEFATREVCMRDCEGTLIILIERDPAGQDRTTPDVAL